MMKSSELLLKPSSKTVPCPSQLSTNRSSAFLTSIPSDDLAFVQSEIAKIDKDLYIREQHKKKIWNQTSSLNVYADHGKSNHQILSDIRRKVIGSKGIHSVDWGQPQSYLPKESLESVFDSLQIQNFIANKGLCKERYVDLYTYKTQSKEVCLRNMLLDVMHEEQNKIKREKVMITNALSHSLKKLNEDMETFEKFTEDQRKMHKNNDLFLLQLIKENKRLMERKKKVTQEHRQLLDDTEKTIRLIYNMKFFAAFVNCILGGDRGLVDFGLPEKIEIKNREKDLDEYRLRIFNELGYLATDHTIESEVLSDLSKVMSVYQQIEDNILKLIHIKEESDERKKRYINESNHALKDLTAKVELQQKEYNLLVNDRTEIQGQVNAIKALANVNDSFNAAELIKELGNAMKIDINLLIREKSIMKYLDSSFEVIKSKDEAINNYIKLLSSFEEDPVFFDIVERTRKENRIRRQYEEVKYQLKIEKERKSRLDLKMNRIVIKGRGRNAVAIPPLNHAQSKMVDIHKTTEGNHDFEMLEYR